MISFCMLLSCNVLQNLNVMTASDSYKCEVLLNLIVALRRYQCEVLHILNVIIAGFSRCTTVDTPMIATDRILPST